jgi:methionyl-tRNA formyltransferase
MDHGPILAQKRVTLDEWPPHAADLEERLAREGGALLASILPAYIAGEIEPHAQNHDIATYTKKFEKEDAEIDLRADAYQNFLKIRAYEGWPTAFAYFERDGKLIRVQILDAHFAENRLIIDTVKPEGKREMPYLDFLRSGARPSES